MNYLKEIMKYSRLTVIRFCGLYLSLALIIASVVGVYINNLNLGIDFTGGFISEFSTSQSISQKSMQMILEETIDGKFRLTSSSGQKNWTVRQPDNISSEIVKENATSKSWLVDLKQNTFFQDNAIVIEILDSDYIGSQVGEELIGQGGLAMLTALIMILLYLSARFEWRFALGAIFALLHDVVFVMGIFAWLQLEFDLTVLASLLAIIGYSLNDSIIVADRIRELMRVNKNSTLDKMVNNAIQSTLTRTLITSGTTLATVTAVWWLAGKPLEGFSVALFIGILVGTYSSICISATLPEVIGLDIEYYNQKVENTKALGVEAVDL